jgi:hypothetical protein
MLVVINFALLLDGSWRLGGNITVDKESELVSTCPWNLTYFSGPTVVLF